ncbi:MAG: hypothetical protein JXR77_16255 [Lentisphaeria bacterium]|nr:hypothetical protein [Lentisphaeria bacterium]
MTRRELLYFQLNRLRRGYVYGVTRRALLGAAAVVCVFVAAVASADFALRLHGSWCWLAWLVTLALLGGGIWYTVRTWRRPVTNERLALLVEKTASGLENRLINTVQFVAGGRTPPEFVEAVLAEADTGVDRLDSRQLYSRRADRWALWSLLGALLLLAGLSAVSPRRMGHALGRVLLPMAGIEPYTVTRLVRVEPGDATVLRGQSLVVRAVIEGDRPESGIVVWERARDRTDTLPLAAAQPSGPAFQCELKGVYHPSRYRVVAGDARSPWYAIAVTNPPGLEYWEAKITPPDHVRSQEYRLDSASTDASVHVGATVVLAGSATAPLREAAVVQDDMTTGSKAVAGRRKFAVTFKVRDGGSIRLRLTGEDGLESTSTMPFAVQPDQKPGVVLLDTKQRVLAAANAQVPVSFQARDDHGLTRVGLERMLGDDRYEPVSLAEAPAESREFSGRFLIDLPSFDAREGETLRFRVWAEDNGEFRASRRGYAPVIQVAVPVLEDRRNARRDVAEQADESLKHLIAMQRENLKNTRTLCDLAALGKEVPEARLQPVQITQKNIRDLAGELLQNRAALGDFATLLAGLVNHEMAEVLERFEEARRVRPEEVGGVLKVCVRLETAILAALTGIPTGLAGEQKHQDTTDLFAALQNVVALQRTNLKESKDVQAAAMDAAVLSRLAGVEDRIATDLVAFTDMCLVMVEERVDDDFAAQLRAVYDLLETERTYEKVLTAAEALEEADLAAGIQNEEEALEDLMQALNILNQWRMRHAQKIVRDAVEALRNTHEKLEELEGDQNRIAEVTRDLAKRGVLDDEVREKLRAMDEEQKEMAELVEQLANDLYQFPELPVCNELNSKMREILEDVEQAMGSENAPAIEIAVQKEDSLLDAIRNTKERVEDVEMWLPDIPDNIVWNMESFDTDEFPDMPLVPLPDELEDIVGDLLDQASDIDAQSQDSTGNNMIADMEMGWAVMDGPMPSFAAKGKSGNARPNDNEMTGRSGAGREGQSTGELVENHVKGLEGRTTHARRTQDPFQKGMVTEDENSTMDARATGGGKLGGESESIGMFGQAPRRDLHQQAMGGTPTKLRQETEALYATARLLYLGTGSLGMAARELRGVENAGERMKEFGSLHRRVLRRLEDTQVELNSGVVLPMPVASVSKAGGAATDDVDIGKISEEYRDIVSEYYRSLQNE